ncbi:hypothetical protein BT96DRAFT_996636 [Gymnopus androsaceus JB14]|uniref:Ribonuclease H1 N-terminal domain-containing protein n=1 Tax=Gymnopus androsaceus JB14 TaxID=1447944 RepID=A0A6A4HFG0_9AGAR|nr:hypothetical protein BT96DRAFT_996636 [Gymnopus androsaceus JB14]
MTQTKQACNIIQEFTPAQIYAAVEYLEQAGGQPGPPNIAPVVAAPLTHDLLTRPASPATTTTDQAAMASTMASFNAPPFIICTSCGTVNIIPNSDIHYVVTVGKSVGVFSDLAYMQTQVSGVSGACYKRYSTQAAALQAYQQAAAQGVVRIVN